MAREVEPRAFDAFVELDLNCVSLTMTSKVADALVFGNKWWQYFDVHPLDRNRVGFSRFGCRVGNGFSWVVVAVRVWLWSL